jgi:hypothetical protein
VKQLLDTYGLRVAAALVAAAALGGALYRVPALVRISHHSLKQPGMSLEDADLDPLKYFVSIGALVTAENTIPRGATWTIVVGHDPPLGDTPAQSADLATAIPPIFRMWLLPLRYTPKLHKAQWVITYHHSSESLGIKYSKEIYLSYDANLLKVVP